MVGEKPPPYRCVQSYLDRRWTNTRRHDGSRQRFERQHSPYVRERTMREKREIEEILLGSNSAIRNTNSHIHYPGERVKDLRSIDSSTLHVKWYQAMRKANMQKATTGNKNAAAHLKRETMISSIRPRLSSGTNQHICCEAGGEETRTMMQQREFG